MQRHSISITLGLMLAAEALSGLNAQTTPHKYGYDDTPYLPDGKWRVHDSARPLPQAISPSTESTQERAGRPPSDAVVLFDGTDLSHWQSLDGTKQTESKWKVGSGYVEVTKDAGALVSKEKFGDCQLHVEWATPAEVKGEDQARGNSGVLLMSRYEIQVLDSYNNPTYADGHAGGIYGQYPPLVNPARRPGEWQSFDIIFEAPRFEAGKVVKPAVATVIYNGVLVEHHRELLGASAYRELAHYDAHGPEEPIMLQNHWNPVRFRNIWVRPLKDWK